MSESKQFSSSISSGLKAPIVPFILITSLFFMWGLANNLTDTLLAAFKRIMSMSDFQTSWIQIAFYGAYFCLALPAAVFIKKFTYKSGVLLGLGLYVVGALLFYPSSIAMQYGLFLGSLYILAGGLAILETACNPYIIAMGDEKTGTQRLNLAQSFNPIGSISGVVISKFYILSQLDVSGAQERAAMSAEQLQSIQQAELGAVMGPYVTLGFVLLGIWLLIAFTKMPKASTTSTSIDLWPTIKRLVRKKSYVLGVVAQFFYVGAQICVWSFTIRYVMDELGLAEAGASNYYIAALIVFTLFRFVNTYLMKYIKPSNLLMGSAMLGVLSTLVVILGSGYVGVIALVAISAFMSLMFPTIFGLASQGLGEDTKIGSSGLIMAIGGGAALPAVQGMISDATGSIHLSYFVPLVCFVIIAFYGMLSKKYQLAES
ncbi:L-fucose:H+ symporter permease [Fodinibius salsisoli]|uniref:L-fucose:H+ symporter permease n=1 Tax=Fodinibius salsisoli TaxID=2820877 RepID=A0ABT3PPY0_9BACT|nr:L-fucose:H+ symporter permease [Fodinibius salsisoli]MCW9707919.1 L-fucose:H+ symporter permease [Fodinibius salsisoli]